MMFIKEESEDMSYPESCSSNVMKNEDTEEQRELMDVKEESQELKDVKEEEHHPCQALYSFKTGQNSFSGSQTKNHFSQIRTLRTRAKKSFSCHQCETTFTQESHLQSHIRSHTGEKPFSCHQCGNTFTRNASLTTHMRIHTGEKPFSCNQCGSTFTRNASLTTHMRIHTGEKPFKCHQCGKRFTQASILKSHLFLHSRVKSYSCDQWGKIFSSRPIVHLCTAEWMRLCPSCAYGLTKRLK
ncbi:gastrula zinc finger protein XlCGF49.1-like isoform X4 [Xyrauchen texanus]|uniref:gastrula zinc finger protein XlCGF49.1-like isoform X4 n=1 Tax=Xyrauchen texanus TaxID=154827 RepID=UPI002241B5EB|nr:gastrula zinc finger protein XlCGF49.1-like isoform X4 [Xyrauchen texanus]